MPQLDLVEAFPHTEAGCVRDRIDLGTRDGDLARGLGWAAAAEGEQLGWVAERRATLRLCLDEPRERRLRVRARASSFDPRRLRRRAPVVVHLNRQRIGKLDVGEDLAVFELVVPRRAQRAGENLLELEHPLLRERRGRTAPAVPDGTVGYDWLEIDDAADRRARASTDGDALLLPAGARVDYFLRLPGSARLRLAVDPAPDGAAPRLRVLESRDGDATRSLGELTASGRRQEIELALGDDAGRPVGLSLVAEGSGTVRVVAPRVLGTPPPAATPRAAAASPAGARPINVVLYVVDTLRADHLGCYGYDLPTSPRLDALARDGVLFERVVAQSSWTRPAVASLLTGLDPFAHGATGLRQGLPANAPTLAELLAAQGFSTAAFVSNVNVSAPFGFARGFATFVYLPEEPDRESSHVLSDELGAAALRWLEARDGRPFFLYLHASDPHAPYTAASELRARFRRGADAAHLLDAAELRRKLDRDPSSLSAAEVRELVAAYDAEIAFNDASLGALLDALDREGLRGSTLVVVTADHGEEFRDHGGFNHGHTLYEELIRVPLVVRLPDGARAGERVATLARQIDLVPTVLEQLAVAAPPGLPGRSLLAGDEVDPARLEATSHTRLLRRDLAAVTSAAWKAIRRLDGPSSGSEVFDLARDPAERHDVAAERAVLAGYAAQTIRRAASAPRAGAPTPAVVDGDTERRLRALGYAE
ncbi:MAG: sulfatase [Thermodesulfobacteriota bacterium]